MLVKYYGYVGSWEIDHWKNYNLLIKAGYEEIADKNNLNNDDEANEATSSKKETQRLTLEADELLAIAKKIQYIEGLETDEKILLIKKLTDESLILLQKEIDKAQVIIPKKIVGRPSFKTIYRWLDYLVLELGSISKAINYASNFPIIDPRNPDTLKREYRKYRKARGEG